MANPLSNFGNVLQIASFDEISSFSIQSIDACEEEQLHKCVFTLLGGFKFTLSLDHTEIETLAANVAAGVMKESLNAAHFKKSLGNSQSSENLSLHSAFINIMSPEGLKNKILTRINEVLNPYSSPDVSYSSSFEDKNC